MLNTQLQIGFSSLTIDSCFKNHYIVPDYQREYVWNEKHIEQLLTDLMDAYNINSKKDYFLGTIVTFNTEKYFELIDGQQRLTTFYLLLCSLRNIYKINGEDTQVFDSLIYSSGMEEDGTTVSSYHLQLQYEEASNYLELIYASKEEPKDISDSGKRLFDAFHYITEYLTEKLTDIKDLKKFAFYLLNRTRFVQIETYDLTDALKIFETINQRGVGLNPMDLLKNMIFRQVDRSKFKELNMKWKEITSTLESIHEKPLRFLRYFIMSNYDVSGLKDSILREDDIYNWLSENDAQCNYIDKPFEFVDRMIRNVKLYTDFLNPLNTDNGNIHLLNIRELAGSSYKLHLMLLLSADNMEPQVLDRFKGIIESIVYYTVVDKITTNVTERTFAGWCPKIRNIKTDMDLNNFIANDVVPTVDTWKVNNEQFFMNLGMKSMQQYRIKFIMAKITAYIDSLRLGTKEVGVLDNYLTGIEIEHIMPQTCDDKAMYGVTEEEYDIYLHRLGNLTLLENSINKSIRNNDYVSKSAEYRKSKFYLTKSLSGLETQGTDTAINRANKKLCSWEQWNKTSIDERQQMLYWLSEEIWGIKTE